MTIWQISVRHLSSGPVIKIGNVTRSARAPLKRHLVPHNGRTSEPSQTQLAHLKWMLQKDIARQDVFLIGHPGPTRRRLASLYCALVNREVEHLVLSRDTTEGDVKQRREISAGSSIHLPGPAVRAACEGHALIIEGIERAEQNLLPLINNLLENREMHLEDGRFLVAHQRYDTLTNPSSDLIRVHPDFWVVALGVPVPPYRGYPLDPPLRSRFQARVVKDLPYNEHKKLLLEQSCGSDENKINSLLSFANFFKESEAKTLPYLNSSVVDNLCKIVNNVPSTDIHNLIRKVYPYQQLLQSDSRKQFEKMVASLGISHHANPMCVVTSVRDGVASVQCGAHTFSAPAGTKKDSGNQSTYISTPQQETLLSEMLLSHAVSDICLLGPTGCGKSVVVEEFARRLAYETDTIILYSDLTSRDLLQYRHTDNDGNTVWEHSPLVRAALSGKLLIMDSVQKLHHTALSTLASFCEDRVLSLPDGKRLVSHSAHQQMCHKLGVTEEELRDKGVLSIHPSFRIIATSPDKGDWITPDVLGLWHYHHHTSLDLDQQLQLICKLCPETPRVEVQRLQSVCKTFSHHADPAMMAVSDMLTMRRMVAICRAVSSGVHLASALHTSLLIRFMPVLTRKMITATLNDLGINERVELDDINTSSTQDTLTIGSVTIPKLKGDPELIPSTLYFENRNQLHLLEEMARSFKDGSHLLLVGNQGVGKNKVVDRLLGLMEGSREYLQLHRDSTVQSITVQPTISGGRVGYADSALLRAVRHGRVLVVDEADKAPTNVTSVFRTLLDTGSMWLADGRKIVPAGSTSDDMSEIVCHPDFRAIFLANRPGFPFLGNDFYAVMGDLLSCHAVDNPDPDSELVLLKQYGPTVSEDLLLKLIAAFTELRCMSDAGTFLYPYSTRELVNIVKHLQAYPEDGITAALSNVLDFEQQEGDIWDMIIRVLHGHGIPFGARSTASVAPRFPLKRPAMVGKLRLQNSNSSSGKLSKESFRKRGPFLLPHQTHHLPISHERAKEFYECINARKLPTPQNNTKYTQLLSGGKDGILHAVSTSPHLYSILDNKSDVTSLDLSAALGYNPQISAAAFNHHVVLSDTATTSLLLIDTLTRTVERLDLNRIPYFKARNKSGSYVVKEGRDGNCWLFDDNFLVKYSIVENKGVSCELPFVLKDVQQSHLNPDSDDLAVCSTEGDWYQVRFIGKQYTCTPLKSDVKITGNWMSDLAAGEKTDIPYSSDIIQTEMGLVLAENCHGSLANNTDVKLRYIQTGIDDMSCGLLNKGIFVVPAKSVPESYQTDTPTNEHGYLAVVDTVRYSISFVPLQKPVSSTAYHDPLDVCITLRSQNQICSLSSDGILQEWELSDDNLAVSYEKWRDMVGDPPTQLNIERHSGLDVSEPKHGKIDPDNTPHVGGNTWAGGTGGRDTAGLGGKGGPYRLDAGHNVHQLSDEEKNSVPEEVQRAAREMGRKAFEKRLQEIEMSEHDAERYNSFVKSVSQQIASLKQLASGLEAKQGERVWLKNQTDGELDDSKLVEGLTGESNVYKRRGTPNDKGFNLTKPKHLTLLADVSGSMYRFNGLDQRLQRELELMAMVMEGLQGSENRVRYDIIGHSGENPHIPFVKRDLPPNNEKKRLQVLEEMHAHSQFCWTGDHTVAALNKAVSHASTVDADERIVVAFSDANLKRYFIRPSSIASAMTQDPNVSVFIIFIGSLGDEAIQLREVLPMGKTFVTLDTREMPTILHQIFSSTMIH